MADLGDAYVNIIPKAPGIKNNIEGLISGSGAGESAGNSLGTSLIGTLKKVIAAAGIGKILKDAFSAGGNLEQAFGGLETIYGDAAAGAKDYAAAAAQAGISANSYAEQAVSFGAALKQAYGGDTVKAMEAANTAIMDMADNSAKMGTDIGSVQAAYQGFAKQNYTMLDNLKLGYGGTKTEMERLLADATELSGVEYNIDNLGDVYDAIHVIQEDLGLTGVAASEAESTLTGSAGAMKASWENLLAAMTTGEGMASALSNLGNSVGNFGKNVIRMAGNIGKQLPQLLTGIFSTIVPEIVPVAGELIAGLADGIMTALPALGETALTIITELVNGIVTSLPQLAEEGVSILTQLANGIVAALPQLLTVAATLIPTLAGGITGMLPQIMSAGIQLLMSLVNGIISSLPQLLTTAMQLVAQLVAGIASNLPQILQSGIELLGELVSGIIQAIPDLIAAIPQIFSSAVSAFQGQDWASIGRNIISGIVKGISNAAGNLFSALKNLAKSALGSAKEELEINSPSKVFQNEVGSAIPEGIALGINQNTSYVSRAIDAAVQTMTGDYRRATAAGNVTAAAKISDTDRMIDAMQNMTVKTNVVMQGDARKFLRVMTDTNNSRTKATNYNALAAAGA